MSFKFYFITSCVRVKKPLYGIHKHNLINFSSASLIINIAHESFVYDSWSTRVHVTLSHLRSKEST